ncbi:MAG: hypothetical protein RLZZ116_2760 [Planctomycetota bacterium]|jgi:hypothetical protein
MTIDRKTLLKYDPLPDAPPRRSKHDRRHALIIALVGMVAIMPYAAWGVTTYRTLILYSMFGVAIGSVLEAIVAILGLLDGGIWGAWHRLRYPLANWGKFGPTGGRFIDHDDHWYYKRLAIAWLYLWLWLALPLAWAMR